MRCHVRPLRHGDDAVAACAPLGGAVRVRAALRPDPRRQDHAYERQPIEDQPASPRILLIGNDELTGVTQRALQDWGSACWSARRGACSSTASGAIAPSAATWALGNHVAEVRSVITALCPSCSATYRERQVIDADEEIRRARGLTYPPRTRDGDERPAGRITAAG